MKTQHTIYHINSPLVLSYPLPSPFICSFFRRTLKLFPSNAGLSPSKAGISHSNAEFPSSNAEFQPCVDPLSHNASATSYCHRCVSIIGDPISNSKQDAWPHLKVEGKVLKDDARKGVMLHRYDAYMMVCVKYGMCKMCDTDACLTYRVVIV